jgi:mono/diheme cytochrome c family protein
VSRRTVACLAFVTTFGAFAAGVHSAAGAALANPDRSEPKSGEQVWRTTCVGCHGVDGAGKPQTIVGFSVPIPDFTDCNATSRENQADWVAIVRDGGPVRGFSRIMPAFRDLLTQEEIRRVVAYLRTFCDDKRWPVGELNVPLALTTEKAFPEDEMVLSTAVDTRGPGAVSNSFVFERRFGPVTQLEVDVPFGFVDRAPGSWAGALGDATLALKRVLFADATRGTIVSGLGGVVLPTGNRALGLGAGTTAFEGFLLAGQLLPARGFFQLQAGVEIPTDLARAPRSASWSGTLGTTIAAGPLTRSWSPMVGVDGARDLVSGAPVEWDLTPQMQVTLSARQHVRANMGVRVPLTQRDGRNTQVLAYLLWDTFDGSLLDGWKGWCPGCQP